MPEIATLKANARRVTDLACAIENVQQPRRISTAARAARDFSYGTQNPLLRPDHPQPRTDAPGRGRRAVPDGTATAFPPRRMDLRERRVGQRQDLAHQGDQRALAVWPRQHQSSPKGVKTFYAAQDVKLPPISLEGAGLPARRARRPFRRARRGSAAQGRPRRVHRTSRRREPRQARSGTRFFPAGRSRSSSSRASCCSSPACCSWTRRRRPRSRRQGDLFHQAIKDNCPGVTVISVMHEAIPPRSATGASFYDSVMTLADGAGTKTPLGIRVPEVEIKKAATEGSATTLFPGGSRPA